MIRGRSTRVEDERLNDGRGVAYIIGIGGHDCFVNFEDVVKTEGVIAVGR